MFKQGDRVKYVVDGKYDNMTLNNNYVVIYAYCDVDSDEYVRITDDTGYETKDLFSYRFELCIRDQRKQKLKKICSKQEIN